MRKAKLTPSQQVNPIRPTPRALLPPCASTIPISHELEGIVACVNEFA